MSLAVALLWLLTVVVDTAGQLAFKAAAVDGGEAAQTLARWRHRLARPWLWLGIACYVVEFLAAGRRSCRWCRCRAACCWARSTSWR